MNRNTFWIPGAVIAALVGCAAVSRVPTAAAHAVTDRSAGKHRRRRRDAEAGQLA